MYDDFGHNSWPKALRNDAAFNTTCVFEFLTENWHKSKGVDVDEE